ncbi:MAG: hypothetical protein M1820_002645 [Bogoriella megaspora]|nr:MAG: hypothetical protein M1820_002645 [Bogoriella megaspora]
MPDWKNRTVQKRLLAAVLAAGKEHITMKEIAGYFGEGATYDSIESHLRPYRKMAQQMRDDLGENPEPAEKKLQPRKRKAGDDGEGSPKKKQNKPKAKFAAKTKSQVEHDLEEEEDEVE